MYFVKSNLWLAIITLIFGSSAFVRGETWQGGTGNWSAASSNPGWNGPVPNGTGSTAEFTAVDATNRITTQDVLSGVIIGSLNFTNTGAGYREIQNLTGITINQDSAGPDFATITVGAGTISSLRITSSTGAPIMLADDLKIINSSTSSTDNNGVIQIGSAIAGIGNLTISSSQPVSLLSSNHAFGSIRLTGANTFTGSVNVLSGLVNFNRSFGNPNNVITIGGVPGSVAAVIAEGVFVVPNNIVVAPNTPKAIIGNSWPSFPQSMGFSGATLISEGSSLFIHSQTSKPDAEGLLFSGVVSGPGNLVISGSPFSSTVTLGNANTYSGKTSIQYGYLRVTSINSISGSVSLLSKSSLGAPTTIENSVIELGEGLYAGTLSYIGDGEITNRRFRLVSTSTGGGGIDAEGTGPLTITGEIDSNTTSAKTLTLSGWNCSNNTIAGNIVNGSSSSLSVAKTDGGKWILAGNNTYTGMTSISDGTLQFNSPNSIAGTGKSISMIGNSRAAAGYPIDQAFLSRITSDSVGVAALAVNSSNALDFSSSGENLPAVLLGATGNATYSGVLTPNGSTYRFGGDGTLTVASLLSGAKNVAYEHDFGGGTVILANANTFTGKVTILGGALSVSSLNRIVGRTPSSNLGAPTTVADGTIDLSSRGILKYTGVGETTDRVINTLGDGGTLSADGSGALVIQSNVTGTSAFNLAGESVSNNTINGSISAVSSLTKLGSGKWILSGANTYDSSTTIKEGVLSVSSINRVVGGSPTSNLGKPTSTNNGIILFGSNGTTGTLLYTGTGETTDRRIGFNEGNIGGVIDSSGTGGPLVFSSPNFSNVGTYGTIMFTLQGTNTSDNTIYASFNLRPTQLMSVTKSGTGKWILRGASGYTGTTIVNDGLLEIASVGSIDGSSSITINAPASFLANHIRTPSLTVDGLATIRANGGTAGASKVETLTVGASGKLNLKDNDLVVGTGTVAAVRAKIVLGKANNSAAGITSDSAGFGVTRGFGYALGSDINISPLVSGPHTLTGQTYDADSVLVKYTFLGDADLDGDTDLNDLGLWAQSFTGDLGNPAIPATFWTSGDFDYDGDTDLNDLGFWAGTFTGDLGGGAGSLIVVAPNAPATAVAALNSMGITVVPEPSTFLLTGFGLTGLALIMKRNRKS